MSDRVLLPAAHMRRIAPFLPRSRGLARVDDRRVISGIIYVIRHGLRWKDAPRGYGPHKTLYIRFIRWSRLGVSARIFSELTAQAGVPERLMIDATHLKAFPRCIGRTKGGLNSKLHAVCDGAGRPIVLLLTEGQMRDHKGASLMLPAIPPAKALLADRG